MSIDWSFLRSLEGFSLKAYVPSDQDGKPVAKSGVTLATGVDLGGVTQAELRAMALPPRLLAILPGYCGLVGVDAQRACTVYPLMLSSDEAYALDEAFAQKSIDRQRGEYGQDYDSLPVAARTVMFSVGWQYGDLPRECPRFWSACRAKEWLAVIKELLNFGDIYPTRRRKEAAYLAKALDLPLGEAHP